MNETKQAPYEVDDRGNVVQFYDTETNEIVAEINREDTVNGVPDQSTYWGGPTVTAWAIENGYPEISNMPRAQ